MTFTEQANKIFQQAIRDYHLTDNVDTPVNNPYDRDSIEYKLYLKCRAEAIKVATLISEDKTMIYEEATIL